jgi:hypothetical protein
MQLVNSYLTGPLLTDDTSLARRYQYMMYNIPVEVVEFITPLIQTEKTVVLFSGSWRFTFDFIYIELKMMENCGLNFHKSTLFIDHNNHPLFDLTLKSIRPKNIAILHSDFWTAHQPVDQLLSKLDQLINYVQPGGQVICTVPLKNLNFNRLTTTYSELGFNIVNNSAVIVRK